METKFIQFCENGDLDNIKQLINSHKINIHANNEAGFRLACENGHKHIVKYLLSVGCYLHGYNDSTTLL
jgi:ankyrin repeat protein